MILVYSENITNRLRYTFKQIFKEILGLDVKFTKEKDEFQQYIGAKLSYASQPVGDELFFQARRLLFEKGVQDQEIAGGKFEGHPCFFEVGERSEFPFDPFAASFYLLSRYEEYLPHKRDQHGRFTAEQSLGHELGFLRFPIVDFWAQALAQRITKRHPNVGFPERRFSFVNSIDVDNAYAFLGKGLFRNLAGLTKSVLTLNIKELVLRLQVLTFSKRDPYDTYSFLMRQGKRYGFSSLFFFLMGDYSSFDKNLPGSSSRLKLLIKSIADDAQIGIHPSYYCEEKGMLKKELRRLSRIVNDEVKHSRQHYLRLNLPSTYRMLIDHDITDDYTMGYASLPGFRAGTCSAYYFYDLDLEMPTHLRVHPFAFMEGTFRDYMNLRPEQVMPHLKGIIDGVKQVNGTLISLWHNDSLAEVSQWKGWRKLYENMLKYIHE